jgi:UDP-N-acetylmuramate-alanine ligase
MDDPIARGLETGVNVATMGEIPGAIQFARKAIPQAGRILTEGAGKVASNVTGKIAGKRLTAQAALEGVEQAAKQAKHTFSGDDFLRVGQEYVATDPRAAKALETVKPILKDMNPQQMLKQLKVWNKAYTAAGKEGKSAIAGLYSALSREARRQMTLFTPELASAYGTWASRLGQTELAKKLGRSALFTIPSAVAGAGVYAALQGLRGE